MRRISCPDRIGTAYAGTTELIPKTSSRIKIRDDAWFLLVGGLGNRQLLIIISSAVCAQRMLDLKRQASEAVVDAGER